MVRRRLTPKNNAATGSARVWPIAMVSIYLGLQPEAKREDMDCGKLQLSFRDELYGTRTLFHVDSSRQSAAMSQVETLTSLSTEIRRESLLSILFRNENFSRISGFVASAVSHIRNRRNVWPGKSEPQTILRDLTHGFDAFCSFGGYYPDSRRLQWLINWRASCTPAVAAHPERSRDCHSAKCPRAIVRLLQGSRRTPCLEESKLCSLVSTTLSANTWPQSP